jgi:hypothetical protein
MLTSLYVLEVLCFVQKYKGIWSKTLRFMNITWKENMTCIHSFVIQLRFKKNVLNAGVKLYKHLPSKIKKLDDFNHFIK